MVQKILEYLRLKTAAAEVDLSAAHLTRVLTATDYSHLDPRPKIYRLPTGNTNVLVRHEPADSPYPGWEAFKKQMLEGGLRAPKKAKLMEERHQARLARERAADERVGE